MLRTLSPVVHPYDFNLYRVPLRREKDNYMMFVADNFTRVFIDETLPDEVKSKMAMILARGCQIIHDHEVTELSLMTLPSDYDIRDIGWQVSDMWFVIVLPYRSLMGLCGSHQRE